MIKIRQIKLNVLDDSIEKLRKKVISKYRIKDSDIKEFKIEKKSIDARDKNNIYYVYEVLLVLEKEDLFLKRVNNNNVLKVEVNPYSVEISGKEEINNRPIVVGAGPAGLFCAYFLAKYNYKPIIIERGEKIENRVVKVDKFFETGILDTESNVQFGEGGAGTFSDGKLNTLVKDKKGRMKKVFEILVENGAPKEILYENKPHIGTDILKRVVTNIRNKIIEYGGEFRFSTKLTNIEIENNRLKRIEVNNNLWIDCNILVLAIGNSARDTFRMLFDKKIEMTSKPFAVGVRISHPQEMINKSQYNGYENMPKASYKLTYQTKNKRGVYSFCMCPGGYVINASSEDGRLVVNGMSNYMRDSKNSNSAIIVTVSNKDYGNGVLDGILFQERLEEKAYTLGRGNIPVQLYKDFLENRETTNFLDVLPEFKGNYTFANLNLLFDEEICNSLKEAINYFDTKISGFARSGAIIAGVETRTSSPVRIVRNDELSSNILGIYPCGEGSGYSGGITTSAMDGMKVFEIIARKYKPF